MLRIAVLIYLMLGMVLTIMFNNDTGHIDRFSDKYGGSFVAFAVATVYVTLAGPLITLVAFIYKLVKGERK